MAVYATVRSILFLSRGKTVPEGQTSVISDDATEDPKTFLEKRKPTWKTSNQYGRPPWPPSLFILF